MNRIALLGALALAAGCAQTPPAPSPEAKAQNEAFGLMRDGKAEGYAQNRFMLRARAQTLPGSRLLDDAFSGLRLAFALPKNRPAAAQYVAAFVEEAKKSGEVQHAIDAAGLAAEVKVAPAE